MVAVIRALVTYACFLGIVAMGAFLLAEWFTPAEGADYYERTYRPCDGSDTDVSCVWDRHHMGEGDGFSWSFYVDGHGRVYRLPHHVAHFLLTH